MFQPHKLAPTYPESAITKPFPFNAYYDEDEAPEVDGDTYKLEIDGLVENKQPWTLEGTLQATAGKADHPAHLRRGLERDRQLDRRAALRFSATIGADLTAKYVYSSAPKAIPTPSTCRARCTRRRR